MVAAQGAWLHLADGRRVLDGISSWWTCLHGHGHPRLVAAMAAQAQRLDHVLFAGCTHPGAVELAERLVALAPGGLQRVFFSDDGSTAVEVALKMAAQYQIQRGRPDKRGFVAFAHGYHGDTVGAMSVGDPGEFANPFGTMLFPVARLPGEADGGLEALAHLLAERADTIAALIIEPMLQAAGGMRLGTPGFLRAVADLCRAHDVLLVADEVATGFGRTGRLFAVEHAGVEPDLLCLAKGLTGGMLPLAATLATADIYAAFLDPDPRRAFLHGHSFTANPIACAAALASLDVWRDEPVWQRLQGIEAVHAARLPALAVLPAVASVRWLGTIGVVELRETGGYFAAGLGQQVAAAMLARGVLLRPLGPVVYLMPPYCVTEAELDAAYDDLADVLAASGPA